jgi:hypothetical protein
MFRRILALATLLAAGLLGAHVPGANVASDQIATVMKVYVEKFGGNEGVDARLSPSGSMYSGSSRSSARLTSGVSIGENESVRQQERKHEASASVRLVNRDGDVIWSTIQESQGAKFRSAAADVAERIGRQLAADYTKVLERRVAATVGGASGK